MNPALNLTRNFANPRAIRPAPDPVPPGARPEIFLQDVGDVPEERWVQQAENVAFLPLTFGVTQGYYLFYAAPYVLTLLIMIATSSRTRSIPFALNSLGSPARVRFRT